MNTYQDIRTLQSAKPETTIQPFHKGLGSMQQAMEPGEIVQQGWNLLRPRSSPPQAWAIPSILQIGEGDDIRVGDMIGFDISHPCLTFDRWRYLPVLDAAYNVLDVVETFF
jgi:D-serine deaminase-like pyridoxal phosphate-dependent protein